MKIVRYIKQAWAHLRQEPLVGSITVFGTAIAIFLIMLVVMLQQVKYEPFAPESNRGRMLYAMFVNSRSGNARRCGPMSVNFAKEIYKSLETPELVTIHSYPQHSPLSVEGRSASNGTMLATDDDFWKIFDFDFIYGKPYTKADLDSRIKKAVISRSIAIKLFGTDKVTGKEIEINYFKYKVCGIVKDISSFAEQTCADVWVPYSTTNLAGLTTFGVNGKFKTAILARSRRDFKAIKDECNRKIADYNKKATETGYKIEENNGPYDQKIIALTNYYGSEPSLAPVRRRQAIIILILLIIPAINLSSMTQSRLRRQTLEIGIRRAFGCTRAEIFGGIITENFITTVAAGITGWLLGVLTEYISKDITAQMIMHISTFLYALGICFILNMLYSIIPAWKTSKISIINAIEGISGK
ncbi:MAG: ABC transporter permease [Bacteroidales bacterium]|jgi:putative ABC transport system permease protein|nr:ABC transporter permease [Bacteroidales bacterium]